MHANLRTTTKLSALGSMEECEQAHTIEMNRVFDSATLNAQGIYSQLVTLVRQKASVEAKALVNAITRMRVKQF